MARPDGRRPRSVRSDSAALLSSHETQGEAEMEARNTHGHFAVRVLGRWRVVPTSLHHEFRRHGGITQD